MPRGEKLLRFLRWLMVRGFYGIVVRLLRRSTFGPAGGRGGYAWDGRSSFCTLFRSRRWATC